MDVDAQKKQEAVRALINIAMIEGFVLVAVVAVWWFTGSLAFLIIGVIGSTAVFAPMFLRWVQAHGGALQATKDGGDGHG